MDCWYLSPPSCYPECFPHRRLHCLGFAPATTRCCLLRSRWKCWDPFFRIELKWYNRKNDFLVSVLCTVLSSSVIVHSIAASQWQLFLCAFRSLSLSLRLHINCSLFQFRCLLLCCSRWFFCSVYAFTFCTFEIVCICIRALAHSPRSRQAIHSFFFFVRCCRSLKAAHSHKRRHKHRRPFSDELILLWQFRLMGTGCTSHRQIERWTSAESNFPMWQSMNAGKNCCSFRSLCSSDDCPLFRFDSPSILRYRKMNFLSVFCNHITQQCASRHASPSQCGRR